METKTSVNKDYQISISDEEKCCGCSKWFSPDEVHRSEVRIGAGKDDVLVQFTCAKCTLRTIEAYREQVQIDLATLGRVAGDTIERYAPAIVNKRWAEEKEG